MLSAGRASMPSVRGDFIALQTSFCDVFIANVPIAMTMKIQLIVQADTT